MTPGKQINAYMIVPIGVDWRVWEKPMPTAVKIVNPGNRWMRKVVGFRAEARGALSLTYDRCDRET